MVFAILFPGQGAQFRGMGADLFGRYPGLTQFACDMLGYDLVALCRDDPDGLLASTRYTQPALYTVQALQLFERTRREERPADHYLGHSIGEYNALLAAEVFDFATGLRLVKKRAELMAQASGGGMTAVRDTPAERLAEIFAADGVEGIDIAGFNTDAQIVIAGPLDVLPAAHAALERHQIRFAPLRVSGPFHSRHMAPARAEFEAFLADVDFRAPTTPVIANVTGRPYRPEETVRLLCDQLVEPVRWTDSVRHLLAIDPRTECEELGGKALLRMVEHIRAATAPTRPDATRPDEARHQA
ncbi:acyltransferase domain-containing protein [Streptomyces sp. NBC_00237]|uniref:ACP S-malonyltransferase n=1 Tax=Streptomyces sp. NBC_00237 TaxID=2975687 RepID=UPI0022572F34|nr:acyltransferase domain-containing protein [Streptomyces sp. NBC_00237]MCX5202699.1 acyltransferase domain-containing protein [Streptomyces sp. NBC_00237]